MKKILSIILSIAILFGVLPFNTITVNAVTEYTEGYYTYTVANNEANITECDTSISGDITIPSTLDGYPVTSIGDMAFSNCNLINSVTVPPSITHIGESSFWGCNNLVDVYLSDIIAWCNIDFYNWYSNPLYYADNLYLNGVLVENLYIPMRTTFIENYAFCGCKSITSIYIPHTTTSIGYEAFIDCVNLKSIYVENENSKYASKEGVLFNKDFTEIIQYPPRKNSEEYFVPSSVISISDGAFRYSNDLKSVVIGDSVSNIGSTAFYECDNLVSVSFGKNLTKIEQFAFHMCKSLEKVYYCGTEEEWVNISIGMCNESLVSAVRYIHSFGEWKIRNESTCAIEGEEYRICSICNDIEIKNIPTNDEHSYYEILTKPVCIEQGYTTHVCTDCGDSYVSDYTESLGHNFDTEFTIDKPVTETENGSKSRHCTRCDEKTDITVIPRKITLYRYREKTEKMSYVPLESPWILLSRTYSIRQYIVYNKLNSSELSGKLSRFIDEWYYTIKEKDGYQVMYSTQPHNGSVYYFDNALPEAGMYQNNYSYAYHPTTGIKLYYRGLVDTYTLKVYTRYECYYYKWSDWSPWSETAYTSSDNVQVEKIQTYDETLNAENLVALKKSLLMDENNEINDYNADGEINVLDYICLTKYLASA